MKSEVQAELIYLPMSSVQELNTFVDGFMCILKGMQSLIFSIYENKGHGVYRAQIETWKLFHWTHEQKFRFACDKNNSKLVFKTSCMSFFIPGGDFSYTKSFHCINEFSSDCISLFQLEGLCSGTLAPGIQILG